ncbi:MAG: hypothetical protein ACK6CT_00780 [Planctomycetia bacterium]|jgi:hypothetical protein
MIAKLLAWLSLLLALVFVGLALTGAFAFDVGEPENLQFAKTLFYWGALPALGLSLLLAFVLLVVSAFQPKG